MIADFISALIAASVYVGYLYYIIKNFGIIPSISDSYYELEKRKAGTGIYFTVWTSIVCMFTFAPLLSISSIWYEQILSLLCCTGLLFVGAAPQFKIEKDKLYHMIGAYISGSAAISLCLLKGFLIESLIFAGIAIIIMICTPKEDKTLWIETICFNSLFYMLIYILWKTL